MAKVLEVEDKLEVKTGLYKQDVTIAEKTGNLKLTLWQNDRQVGE